MMLLGVALVLPARAQWEPDRRLTDNPAASLLSRNSERCITSSQTGMVHVCWWDDRSGNCEIYYKRSTDNGLSWSTDFRLTEDTARSWTPSLAVVESAVHLVWFDTRDGTNGEVYYQRSTDAGLTWLPALRISFDTAKSEVPCVAATGDTVHVVWRDNRDARFSWEIYYRRSTDAGQTWSDETRLTTAAGIKWNPSVTAAGAFVHLVWADNRDGNWEIYYKRSTDAGVSWQADVRLTESVFAQQWPCVVASESLVVVAWTDGEDVDGELCCRSSTDGGATWLAQTRITRGAAQPGMWAPALGISGRYVHAVWPDGRDGNFEVYYSRSADQGVNWEPEQRLTEDPAVSNYPCVGAGGSAVHVVWSDYRDGELPEIYYKRNPSGNVGFDTRSDRLPLGLQLRSTVVRDILRLDPGGQRQGATSELLDTYGNKVRRLSSGANDVGQLAAGVYFVRCADEPWRISRVVIAR